MGRAIIGGVITSTLLTLVVVPVIWSYLVRDRKPVPQAKPALIGMGGAMGAHTPAPKD